MLSMLVREGTLCSSCRATSCTLVVHSPEQSSTSQASRNYGSVGKMVQGRDSLPNPSSPAIGSLSPQGATIAPAVRGAVLHGTVGKRRVADVERELARPFGLAERAGLPKASATGHDLVFPSSAYRLPRSFVVGRMASKAPKLASAEPVFWSTVAATIGSVICHPLIATTTWTGRTLDLRTPSGRCWAVDFHSAATPYV